MVFLTHIALLVASAAAMVSAGPAQATVLEAARSIDYDTRSVTDSSDPKLQKRNGLLYCGHFPSADFSNAHELVRDIDASPGTSHIVAAHGCLRTNCKNTSGIYVCNDRDTPLIMSNAVLADHLEAIMDRCCMHDKYGRNDMQQQSGGQQFTDALGGGWNVVVGYANCNHAATQKPDTYIGGSVNGVGCLPATIDIHP